VSELELIETTVKRVGDRRRWQRAWRGFWQGFLVGACVWLAALGAYKLLPLPWSLVSVAAGVALAAALAGWLSGWWRRFGLLESARWLDVRQGLQERLSTALELGRDPRTGEWAPLLVGDASRQIDQVDARRLLPHQLPRSSRWVLLVLLVAATVSFVPEHRSQEYRRKQREQEAVRQAGQRLAELSRRSLERRAPALETTRNAVQSVGELGNQLARNPASRSDALRELGKAADRLQRQATELARNPAVRSAEQAARAAASNAQATAEELQKKLDSLQKTLGGKDANTDGLEKLQQARQAASNLRAQGSRASDSARDSLAQSLNSLAKQAEDLGAVLPSLNEAVAAFQAGQIDQVLKDLEVAERDLDKIRQMAQSVQQLQQQAEKQGKNLAEQLQYGQVAAARNTLLKLAEQLKSGDVSAEQLQAITKELDAAVGPAGPYGKVPQLLKQAARQLQQGEKGDAAESLAQAAKELEDLAQQMADAQDLRGMLDALKRAQLMVGTGSGWGQRPGPPAIGQGGKPGQGVGTWADESGWVDVPEQTDRWDNTGAERPDQASRGLTDRGEPKLPDTLAPTRVKGQFSPGGQMPTITLKGVSLKGESTVAVREAITAAQLEAQSALNQDQVPRAYRGPVKDYFNDLDKKP
jgi:hypothetical protein